MSRLLEFNSPLGQDNTFLFSVSAKIPGSRSGREYVPLHRVFRFPQGMDGRSLSVE